MFLSYQRKHSCASSFLPSYFFQLRLMFFISRFFQVVAHIFQPSDFFQVVPHLFQPFRFFHLELVERLNFGDSSRCRKNQICFIFSRFLHRCLQSPRENHERFPNNRRIKDDDIRLSDDTYSHIRAHVQSCSWSPLHFSLEQIPTGMGVHRCVQDENEQRTQ